MNGKELKARRRTLRMPSSRQIGKFLKHENQWKIGKKLVIKMRLLFIHDIRK